MQKDQADYLTEWLSTASSERRPRMAMAVGVSHHRHYVDRSTGEKRRHHLHETVLQRRLRSSAESGRVRARRPAQFAPFICYTLAREWDTAFGLCRILGHNDVTTMIYTHLLIEVGREFGVLQTHCEQGRSMQVYSEYTDLEY